MHGRLDAAGDNQGIIKQTQSGCWAPQTQKSTATANITLISLKK